MVSSVCGIAYKHVIRGTHNEVQQVLQGSSKPGIQNNGIAE